MAEKLLLVEGASDSSFFEAYLRATRLTGVKVSPPRDLGAAANGQGNVSTLLPILIPQLSDGRITRLGIVIDADYKHKGVGHGASYKRITDQLRTFGYKVPNPYPKKERRFIFKHPDGLPSIGLWIMPDNRSDGMLEDMIAATISKKEQLTLYAYAHGVVSAIKNPLFDATIHSTKAEVNSWLAWQKMPGKALVSVIGDGLIDLKKGPAQSFSEWLVRVFR